MIERDLSKGLYVRQCESAGIGAGLALTRQDGLSLRGHHARAYHHRAGLARQAKAALDGSATVARAALSLSMYCPSRRLILWEMYRSRRSGPSEASLALLVFAVFALGVALAFVFHGQMLSVIGA